MGSSAPVRLLIDRCTGLVPSPWLGVFLYSRRAFLYSRRARYGSVLAFHDFRITFLAELTAASTFVTLPCGQVWELVTCTKFHWWLNSLNSIEVNWEPLSDTHVSGIPCLANCDFNYRRPFVSKLWHDIRAVFSHPPVWLNRPDKNINTVQMGP